MEAINKTAGQVLKNTRESKNITIDDVAKFLLLSKNVVVAIENDDYSHICAQVYAEGYIKAYAKFLQIPTNTILTNFRSMGIYSSKFYIPDENTSQIKKTNKVKIYSNLLDFFKTQHSTKKIVKIFPFIAIITIIFYVVRLNSIIELISFNAPDTISNINSVSKDTALPNTPTTSQDISNQIIHKEEILIDNINTKPANNTSASNQNNHNNNAKSHLKKNNLKDSQDNIDDQDD